MAHWAEIDENNIVVRVLVTSNDEQDEGEAWLKKTFGGTWLKCSYNTRGGVHTEGGEPLRYNFPGKGWSYDAVRDGFIPVSPFPSWILNEDTLLWEAPIPRPTELEPYFYVWNEETQEWGQLPA